MRLGDSDLFELWRLLLGTACGIYALVVTIRSVLSWVAHLAGQDRTSTLMRSYLSLHLLRLRWGRFTKELAIMGLYVVILMWLLNRHLG